MLLITLTVLFWYKSMPTSPNEKYSNQKPLRYRGERESKRRLRIYREDNHQYKQYMNLWRYHCMHAEVQYNTCIATCTCRYVQLLILVVESTFLCSFRFIKTQTHVQGIVCQHANDDCVHQLSTSSHKMQIRNSFNPFAVSSLT